MESFSRRQRWAAILKLAWPLIIANGFWNLQLTIDRVILGQYSTEALGAAMAVSGIFWTPLALVQQTSAYLMTFVAQYLGAKEEHMIGRAFWQSVYLGIFGGALMILTIPFSEELFQFVGHSPGLQKLEVEYFDSLTYSAMPTAFVAAASAFFTGLGRTKVIILINCVGLVVNAVLNYILIFGYAGSPSMGIAGAGYATTAANWASAVVGFALVFQNKNEVLYRVRSGWAWSWNLMKRYVRFGVPSGMQWALEGLAFTAFLVVLGRTASGEAALASSGIVTTVMMLAVLPALGVAQAVSVEVGRYLGERRPELAEKATWSGLQICAMYILTIASTFLIMPGFYLGWFENSANAALWSEVTKIVPVLLVFVAVFIGFDSMNLCFSFALKGAGDTKFVTYVALAMPWPLMVMPAWLARNDTNAVYLAWGAASVYIILQAMVFLYRFRGGAWKSMSVIHG